jgi:hypothetical protein
VNYGGRYYYDGDTTKWLSNGESTYSGTSTYDSELQTYNGNFEYASDENYTWDNVTYDYEGAAKMSYTTQRYVVEESDFTYTTNEDYYKVKVREPLVTRYDCYQVFEEKAEGGVATDALGLYYVPYVSGVEVISYKQGDEEGSFEIDYGNGECDSKITIIEKGKRVEIDLGETNVVALKEN